MAVYAPDGGYPEGVWGYGTTFNVLLIEMLENGLGTDFGLSEQEGVFEDQPLNCRRCRDRRVYFSTMPTERNPVYAPQVTQAMRRLTFGERRGLVVADHLQGLRPGACVEWGMMTRATVTSEGSDLLLLQNARRLRLTVSGAPGRWEVREADPPPAPHDSPYPSVRRVCYVARAPASGILAIEVRLTAG